MTRRVRHLVLILWTLSLCMPSHAFRKDAVAAYEGTITIPTYVLPEQDPNPHFQRIAARGTYPYSKQDNLGAERVDVTYRAVFLENDYLRITCLPQLGGRLYSVFDKSSAKEAFYRNEVIKPNLIAMRGAWFSGGIEWNAGPRSHGVTSYSPASVTTQTHEDGSATLVIGSTDQMLRTKWLVRVTLHPGCSCMDQKISLLNPTDTVHTYYFWNNTAFPQVDGTRFVFPMSLGTDHGWKKFFRWPIHEGKDLTDLRTYDRGSSIFAVDCTYDFFGGYNIEDDRGVVQCGDHHRIGGKKAWTWGQTEHAYRRQANLTDDGTRYIEIQSGPLPTQSDLGFLYPLQARSWREYWYPIHGLVDGFEYATKDMAIQVHRAAGEGDKVRLTLRAIGTGEVKNARATLSSCGKALFNEKVDVTPRSPLVIEVDLVRDCPVDVSFVARNGAVLAAYTTPLNIPVVSVPEKAEIKYEDQAEVRYLRGLVAERKLRAFEALEHYQSALEADPGHVRAHVALAVLSLEMARHRDAIDHLEQALARDAHYGWAWYFLGAAHLAVNWHSAQTAADLGRGLDAAMRAAHQAAQEMETQAEGMDLVGRVYLRQGNSARALDAFAEAEKLAPESSVVATHAAVAAFAGGEQEDAARRAARILETDPLNIVASAIRRLAKDMGRQEFVETLLTDAGEDEFEILEAAVELAKLGLVEEAHTVLDIAVSAEASPLANRPMPSYYLRYFEHLLGKDLGEAARWAGVTHVDRTHVCPSRPESLPVLQYAVEHVSEKGHAALYLGNLYAGLGRLDEAKIQWENALQVNPSLNVAARNLGVHAWKIENDPAAAIEYYLAATKANPVDLTLYRDIGTILTEQGDADRAIGILSAMPKEGAGRGDDAVFILARAYLAKSRYDDVLALLGARTFSNWENQTTPHDLFVETLMSRGKHRFETSEYAAALGDFEAARTYPENLGVGRPANPQEAEILYWVGRTYKTLGDAAKAKAAYEQAVAGPDGRARQNDAKRKAQEALRNL